MKKLVRIAVICLLVAIASAGWAQAPQLRPRAAGTKAVSAAELEALLATSCVSCHSGAQAAGGLRLASRAGITKGGKSGLAVMPGNAGASPLFQRLVASDRASRMTSGGTPLRREQNETIKRWNDIG